MGKMLIPSMADFNEVCGSEFQQEMVRLRIAMGGRCSCSGGFHCTCC